jgi:hypothetical protein
MRKQVRADAATACALLVWSVATNASPYVVTLDEVGANVVATGSGSIDLTGLDLLFVDNFGSTSELFPSDPKVSVGSAAVVFLYAPLSGGGLSGPSSFGAGGDTPADNASGNWVSMIFGNGIGVPNGYTSDTDLGIARRPMTTQLSAASV